MRARLTLFAGIAFSRAGAIAATMANRRRQRRLAMPVRLLLLIVGALMVGVGAAMTLATGIGAGPFDVLVAGIAHRTGLPFAGSLWLLAVVLATIATLLGTRPGPGTALAPLIIGPVIGSLIGPLQTVLPAARHGLTDWTVAVTSQLTGIGLIGLGAGALIASDLGAGTGDLLAAATSSKLGRSTPVVRTCLEVSFVGVGLMLGGSVGVGTILVAVTIGPAVRVGHGYVEQLAFRAQRAYELLRSAAAEGFLGRGVHLLRRHVPDLGGH